MMNHLERTLKKEDSASPTASLKAAKLTSVADTVEDRDVATVGALNAFMQTKLSINRPEEK